MSTPQPRYSKEEFAHRGDELYEREIRPHLTAEDEEKFLVIDIDTGAYEIDTELAFIQATACSGMAMCLEDGVNVASSLQAVAAPDTICLSHVV